MEQQYGPPPERESAVAVMEPIVARRTAIGPLTAGVAGGAAFILSLVGLAGIESRWMASVSVIVSGLGLLVAGGVVAGRYAVLSRSMERRYAAGAIGAGMAVEALCGLIGIVLGALAIFGLAEAILLPVAVVVFGCGLLPGSGALYLMNAEFERAQEGLEFDRHSAHEAVTAAAGAGFLVGLTVVDIGILALTGAAPLVLALAALLMIGIGVLFIGASLAGRLYSVPAP